MTDSAAAILAVVDAHGAADMKTIVSETRMPYARAFRIAIALIAEGVLERKHAERAEVRRGRPSYVYSRKVN